MKRLTHAKRSYITRNVDLSDVSNIIDKKPEQGDLVIARLDRIRQHTRLENIHGRREFLFPGDELILAAGSRYATSQFYAEIPESLGPCHLVAAGGLAANMMQRSRQVKPATEITLLGVLADSAKQPINLSSYRTLKHSTAKRMVNTIPVLLVLGSDMDSGKTSLACAAVNSFSMAGYNVAAAKLTGTGAGPDYWKMHDAGARSVVDFLDAGLPSTLGLSTAALTDLLLDFKADAMDRGADMLIVELADGILQPENQDLLSSSHFVNEITSALVASDSAVGAVLSAQTVIQSGISVLGLGGVFTRSPLSVDEVSFNTGLPVLKLEQFNSDYVREYLLGGLLGVGDNVAACAG